MTLPKTLQQAELRIAQSSKPTAEAVIARYIISTIIGVEAGNAILREENPNPANIAAIPTSFIM
jgi:hypothetical protein